MKRIASVQDLSCVGKCSLSIALPLLSAMGIECVALPTAVLSAHTAFESFISCDLTDQIKPIATHWKQLGLTFDALYTGYLASEKQVALVIDILDAFRTGLVFVDPAMADHGRLYTGFDANFPEHMRKLCSRADIITPNITEACLLTGTAYRDQHDEHYVRLLLERLLSLGTKTAILTGIRYTPDAMSVASLDSAGTLFTYRSDYVPAVFHGTGDLFASTCVGALTLGHCIADAVRLATDYVVKTIHATLQNPEARWYGVDFETTIPDLLTMLKQLSIQEEPK